MRNILLAGYYGFGNLGDEAILEMFLKIFKNSNNIGEVIVLSSNPIETSKKYSVKSIDRYNIFAIITNLQKSDVLVFGGGSLLQDITSKKSIYYYLFLINLAKLLGKKVVLLSQGIGPIIYPSNKRNTSRTLKKVDEITVRDLKSIELLEEMNIDKSIIRYSADPVINIGVDHTKTVNSDKKRVCFTLRNWKEVELTEEICKVVNKLYNEGIECTFICFHYNMDIELLEELEKKLGNKAIFIKNRLSTQEAMNIIKGMDLLVGIRLHALILSASAYVPFIALSYDPKIDQFLESLDLKVFTDINNTDSIDSDKLFKAILNKLDNKEEEVQKLKVNVNKLRETVGVNLEIIDNL